MAEYVEPRHRMYLNFIKSPLHHIFQLVEPRHRMYLNKNVPELKDNSLM